MVVIGVVIWSARDMGEKGYLKAGYGIVGKVGYSEKLGQPSKVCKDTSARNTFDKRWLELL